MAKTHGSVAADVKPGKAAPDVVARGRHDGRRQAAVLTFRNHRGEGVVMPSFTATDANNEFGRVLDAALEQGAVAITRHDATKAILLSLDEFNALAAARESRLDSLLREFDGLLAGMQTARARKGMQSGFDASPASLGKAAVTAARRRG